MSPTGRAAPLVLAMPHLPSSLPARRDRRCLEDGHYFCSGITETKGSRRSTGQRKFRRTRACASEFDYGGWKTWGDWQRKELALRLKTEGISLNNAPEGCEVFCDFPSECRWVAQGSSQSQSISSNPTLALSQEPVDHSLPEQPANVEPDSIVQQVVASDRPKLQLGDILTLLVTGMKRRKSVSKSARVSRPALKTVPENGEEADMVMAGMDESGFVITDETRTLRSKKG
jgi:hypothetical protein